MNRIINWKKVAKRLYTSNKELEAMWNNKCDEIRNIYYVIAKAAGTPLYSETQISAHDMVVLALKKIGADIPEHLDRPYQKSEAQARLDQLIYRLRCGDKLGANPYLYSALKIKIIEILLK
jgi:hypothetical protein